jgi:hypothetical protein
MYGMFQLTLNLVYSLIFLQGTVGPDNNGQKDMCGEWPSL